MARCRDQQKRHVAVQVIRAGLAAGSTYPRLMSNGELHPVVDAVMRDALGLSNTGSLHPLDEARWLALFPALRARGYTWHEDDIYGWLDEHWPVPPGESWTDHFDAVKVYAWAEMAVGTTDDGEWSASAIDRHEKELGVAASGTADESDEDTRQCWVMAVPALVPAQKGVPSEEWQFMELWVSEDALPSDPTSARIAEGHQVIRNYLSKWNLEVDLSAPVAQTAEGYHVFPTIERPD